MKIDLSAKNVCHNLNNILSKKLDFHFYNLLKFALNTLH